MKKYLLFFCCINAFLSATPCYKLLWRFKPQCAHLTDQGAVVTAHLVEEALVDNLHFDKKGCFTKFTFEIACRECGSSFYPSKSCCRECGSTDFRCISSSKEPSCEHQQKILDAVNDLVLRELGEISVGIHQDDEGNRRAEVTYEDETEDGSHHWKAEVEVTQDPDGSTTVEAGGSYTWKF